MGKVRTGCKAGKVSTVDKVGKAGKVGTGCKVSKVGTVGTVGTGGRIGTGGKHVNPVWMGPKGMYENGEESGEESGAEGADVNAQRQHRVTA